MPSLPLREVLATHRKAMFAALALRLGEAGTSYQFIALAAKTCDRHAVL